ncbi:hypothetical protein SELMODRAFT_138138 [Selaginella moellendorffii]|uniref:Uncharacterized protein n=1 Tax=Selaginella moellendorffii TaxID=88036 RepID=D8TEP6_SELML|nr:hypothetical protein SELMODRAFT_138138 [Selaginella moellendorffii]
MAQRSEEDGNGSGAEECFHEAEEAQGEEVERLYQRVQMMENVIVDIFGTVSALKNAYIQLQSAHSPYNADKLRSADRLVIGELRRLSEIKHMLKGRSRAAAASANSNDRKLVEELQAGLKEKQSIIDSYDSRMQACEKELAEQHEEMERLKESLRRATSKKEKLERRLNELPRGGGGGGGAGMMNGNVSLAPPLFEQMAQAARGEAFSFAKMFIGLLKNADWDLEAAANSIQPGAVYARPIHTRFAFESYVCQRMFNGFENENFYLSGSLSSILDPGKHRHDCFLQFQDMRSIDPLELVSTTPDCLFGKFCLRKYLQIVHEKMEESFFGHLQHRNQVLGGEHPSSQFYHRFLELAKSVWLLHRLAFSFNPTASIFQVKKDTSFQSEFMESVVDLEGGGGGDLHTVGFTVMPGFRLENAVIKCLVYLNQGGGGSGGGGD